MKWFLVGWICLGAGVDQKCVRMASEVIHESYNECNEYFKVIKEDFSDVENLEWKFTCVEAGLIEDVL